ncbi:MAG: cupin domain-containing protein [Candidatus Marinimicrobia bacterium]|nr:cupin domain-containing protein [Candidatus Neomarinimicrobiota bacterium]MCF7827383.1 cupin domain-containing protein [Candidatus Neomarinimicrobiota bacterium]MCF7881384.1 cupin domain-containing protein [Candidatus Neomarinimicrobiota bacterium]
MAESIGRSTTFVKGDEVEWEPADEGIDRKILAYDAEIMMVLARFEAGAIGSVHSHPHRQVTYVESGRFEITIEGDTQILNRGDSFRVPPNVDHGAKSLDAGILLDVFSPARESFV